MLQMAIMRNFDINIFLNNFNLIFRIDAEVEVVEMHDSDVSEYTYVHSSKILFILCTF